MRAFALAAAACLTVGPAEAAILHYDFTWIDHYEDPEYYGWIERNNGSLTIDEARFPGGTVAGATINFWATDFSGRDAGLSITAPTVSYLSTGGPSDPGSLLVEAGIIGWSGFMTYYGAVPRNEFTVVFDENSDAISWFGYVIEGGSLDHRFSKICNCDWVFDFINPATGLPYDELWEAADGTVVKTVTPVPLPAAAPLLLAGTAALWAVGRRRKARQGA